MIWLGSIWYCDDCIVREVLLTDSLWAGQSRSDYIFVMWTVSSWPVVDYMAHATKMTGYQQMAHTERKKLWYLADFGGPSRTKWKLWSFDFDLALETLIVLKTTKPTHIGYHQRKRSYHVYRSKQSSLIVVYVSWIDNGAHVRLLLAMQGGREPQFYSCRWGALRTRAHTPMIKPIIGMGFLQATRSH